MVLQTLLQLFTFILNFFSGDISESFLNPRVTHRDADGDKLLYLEMYANKTDGSGTYISMATFYDETAFHGKCSSTIYRSYYEPICKRQDYFEQNPQVAWNEQPYNWWYNDCGYDRGHMSSAASNTYNYDAMHNSFFVTNIAPQDSWTNRNPWADVEEGMRGFAANRTVDLFLTTCTIGHNSTIHDGAVVVPQHYYKIACALDPENDYPTVGFYSFNGKSVPSEYKQRLADTKTLHAPQDMLNILEEDFDGVKAMYQKGGFPEVPAQCHQFKPLNTEYWRDIPFGNNSYPAIEALDLN